MKNADKPINPSTSIKISDTEFFEYNLPNKERQYSGLTKREHYAGLAMQGLISSFTEKASYGGWRTEMEATVKCAIDYADELLKQLEEK